MEAPPSSHRESNQDKLTGGDEETSTYLPAEQSALELGWRRSFDVPHSCRHCSQVKVLSNQKDSTEPVRLCLAESVLELRQALNDNCALFDFWFGKHKERGDADLLAIFDIDGSGRVQAKFRATPFGIGEITVCQNDDGPHYVWRPTFQVILQPGRQLSETLPALNPLRSCQSLLKV